jgi:hypothetical protein
MLDSLKPDGTATLAIRTPPDVVEPVPGSSRRPRQRMRSAVQALTALREAQNHRNATLAGQQENRRGPLGVRKPLSISHYQTRIREKSNGNGKWRGISERFPEKFCDSPASLVRMGRSRTLRGLSRQSHHAPCQRRIYRNATKYPRTQR